MMLTHNPIIKPLSIIFASIVISACDTDFSNPVGNTANLTSGSADFTTYVSIGDSLTAGYADRALYLSGQENSYPAVLAQQFATVGGGTFTQPLVSNNLGGLLIGGTAFPVDFGNRLILDAATSTPEQIAGAPTIEVTASGLNGMTYNNVGVPGAKSFHVSLANYGSAAGLGLGTANPYFVRFSTAPGTSMIADAAAQMPSFFTLWVGNNDILSFATSGGVGVDQTGNFDPTTYGSEDITDPNVFANVYNGLVGAMTAANAAAKGVLVSLPDVSTIPYFTTVPFNAVPLDQATADTLNTAYAAYNGGVEAILGVGTPETLLRTISFSAGQNAVVISDETLTDLTGFNAALINMRQATANDLLVLPSSSKIGTLANPADPSTAFGIGVPLADGDVLIPSEISAINTARMAYNTTIQAAADADANLIFYDAAADMLELSNSGIDYGTGFINSTYATGGGFSLDGVHPTARGYAFIANRILATINTGFGANIPLVDPGARTTIFFK